MPENTNINSNSNYNADLRSLYTRFGYLTVEDIRSLAKELHMRLPCDERDRIFHSLRHGTSLLTNENELNAYMVAFGKMHKHKLDKAFELLSEEMRNAPIVDIVDYGCGQGLGTICYADYLRLINSEQTVRRIVLIEPSASAMARASLHTSLFFPNAEIIRIRKSFDKLDRYDWYVDGDIPTLHILSNVLDMGTIHRRQEPTFYDLKKFAKFIKSNIEGYNEFVCICPLFNQKEKDAKIGMFTSLLGLYNARKLVRRSGELCLGESWSCNISVANIQLGRKSSIRKRIRIIIENFCHTIQEYIHIPIIILIVGGLIFVPLFFVVNQHKDIYGDDTFYSDMLSRTFKVSYTSFEIPERVTMINDKAFAYTEIYEVNIPRTVKSIGNSAFNNCKVLERICLGDSVRYIGDGAFRQCVGLDTVEIPSSIASLGVNIFESCEKLCHFEGKYSSADNRCLVINGELLSFAPYGLNTYSIPDGISVIGERAFFKCEHLVYVSIPTSVKVINDEAFYCCTNLTSITIPKGVIEVGQKAFGHCENLKSVYCKALNPPKLLGYSDFLGSSALYLNGTFTTNRKYGNTFKTHIPTIYVPMNSIKDYKQAVGWKEYADYIVGYDFEE